MVKRAESWGGLATILLAAGAIVGGAPSGSVALAQPPAAEPAPAPGETGPGIPTVPETEVPEEGRDDAPGAPQAKPTDPRAAAYEAALERFGKSGRYERDHGTVREAFQAIVAPAREAVATLYRGKDQLALATVVAESGQALTKASELGDLTGLEIAYAGGNRVPARVLGVHRESDLALVAPPEGTSVEAKPVAWALSDPLVGSWVVTIDGDELPLAVGVVSHASRRIKAADPVVGVEMDQEFAGEGVRLNRVFPDSGAEEAGLRVNDVIVAVDGKPTTAPVDLVKAIREHAAGDVILVEIRRGDESLLFHIKLKERTAVPFDSNDRSLKQNTMGGDISVRRGGFEAALQTDIVIRPDQCGGPLLNLDGEAVGLTIARAGRVETYALAADYVRKLLPELQSGKYDPAIAIRERLADLSTALTKLKSRQEELTATLAEKAATKDAAQADRDARAAALKEAQKAAKAAEDALAAAASQARQAEDALAQTRREIERIEREQAAGQAQLTK